MTSISEIGGFAAMTEFDIKVLDNFPGKVVRKDLTTLMKKGANVPTYVLEYLLGMYCATDDEDAIETGLGKIKRIKGKRYPFSVSDITSRRNRDFGARVKSTPSAHIHLCGTATIIMLPDTLISIRQSGVFALIVFTSKRRF